MLASQYEPNTSQVVDTLSAHAPYAAPMAIQSLESVQLLHGQREVLIRHGNEVYRLRHTRNDKLILTK
ncbi:hemin uptake protein HemP [Luteimonas sp. MC1572]|nr:MULTISPECIES: hemin uptake protein HemP [unclassified Luteimonas]MBJ6982437.1 hemin uptake protein HemP [Luteimonas sp. MC1572]MBJ7574985.1 hemin uptake protein HemP [Luteimonas sp. MC1828]QQO03697.1 hemin uptake protein HemP [Luteimonas sp. MC1572]